MSIEITITRDGNPTTPYIVNDLQKYIDSIASWTKDKGEGAGSFGTVYFGRKKDGTEDNLAFKILTPSHKIETNLKQETTLFDELTKKISDGCKKYIVDLIDWGTYEIIKNYKLYIVVMEKPKGFIPINKYIENNSNANLVEIQKIYINLLKGIYCINSSGFVHCDIKPANIMVNTNNQEIKYIDFGGLIQNGKKCDIGTPNYFNGNILETYYNGARDLYAIGVTIEKMLKNSIDIKTQFNTYATNNKLLTLDDLLSKIDFKQKVIKLQDFYRSICEDEYIEIGELKKDTTEIYFLNKNGYKTFIKKTDPNNPNNIKTLIDNDFGELYTTTP